jgi:hypothetical protein
MESCLFKFTLTETTGIINTGTSRMPFAWVSSTPNSDGMHDVFFFNMGIQYTGLYRWTLYLTIRMIYLTRNITINLPQLNSMLQLCTDGR